VIGRLWAGRGIFVLFGDAALASEIEPELVGRGAPSWDLGRENRLLRRAGLLMTSGEVKRLFGCVARISGFLPALPAPSGSMSVFLLSSR